MSGLRAGLAEGVLTLTLDRPDRHNTLDPELLAALRDRLREPGDAGAVVLRGAGGRAFSAGFDLDRLTGREGDLEAADASIGAAVDALLRCPLPVVAEIAGHCHGAGVELALSCDLRLCSPDLQLSLGAVGLGVVYRYEFLTRLVAMCGLGRAQDLLLARRRLGAEEALAWGLVSEVVPAADLPARARAAAVAAGALPRTAVAGTKATLQLAAAGARGDGPDGAALEWRERAARSEERRAALAAARVRLGREAGPVGPGEEEA